MSGLSNIGVVTFESLSVMMSQLEFPHQGQWEFPTLSRNSIMFFMSICGTYEGACISSFPYNQEFNYVFYLEGWLLLVINLYLVFEVFVEQVF